MTSRAFRLPVGLTIATAVALAILCGLGTWQLKRLAWKTDLLARIEARANGAPLSLDQAMALPDATFARVALTCPGLASAPFVELYAIENGQAGVRLVSACRPSPNAPAVLVDRGFVADTVSARPPVSGDATPVQLVGRVRASEPGGAFTPPRSNGRFYARDIPAMAAALRAAPAWSVMVVAETSSNPDWEALVASPVPTDIPNRHLEYALTWFGLAAALLGVYAAVLWRRGKA